METNFFTALSALQLSGTLTITVTFVEDGKQTITIRHQMPDLKDPSAHGIPALIVRQKLPADIDSGFIETITTPLQQSNELLIDLRNHEKQIQQIKADKKAQQEKERQKKESESARKNATASKTIPKADPTLNAGVHEITEETEKEKQAPRFESLMAEIDNMKGIPRQAYAHLQKAAAEIPAFKTEVEQRLLQLKEEFDTQQKLF